MKLERYPVKELNAYTFQFFSVGRNGRFEMRILFEPLKDDLFNLAFGVWDNESQTLDDSMETRNGDSEKILATTAATAISFLHSFPMANIFATGFVQPGSLPLRTRKYQMSINKYLPLLDGRYNLFGFVAEKSILSSGRSISPGCAGKWESFTVNRQYDAFLLNRKFSGNLELNN